VAGVTDQDFQAYTLAMFHGDKRIFMSRESGLRPLVEWLDIFRGKYRDCRLHDKVIGLAAARMIVASGLISEVLTLVASRPARDFLTTAGISLQSGHCVDNILTNDRTGICPGEVIALETPDPDEFRRRIHRLVNYDPQDYENCKGQCGYTPLCRECMKGRR